MAERPVFLPDSTGALVKERTITFQWFAGMSLTQKQKSISALHSAANEIVGGPILEVSTKSVTPLGAQLSAFNLLVESQSCESPLLLEAAFQGSKIFERSGQLSHLYELRSGRDIKRYLKRYSEERLIGFRFEDHDWPLSPATAFYDWLYIRGLCRLFAISDELEIELNSYVGFTDIEFNPKKSINCQARSCALYIALRSSGLLEDAVETPESFIRILRQHGYEAGSRQRSLL